MRKTTLTYCLTILISFISGTAFCQSDRLLSDPNIPDSLLNDRFSAYQYYKTHFWDNCQLNDSLLYGNPAYAKRLDAFFDQVVAPLPDSINLEIDRLMAKIDNQSVHDFTLWYLLGKYEHPEYMTHDRVFVHLAESYFLIEDAKINGLDKSELALISNLTDTKKRLSLFMPAPSLCLKNSINQNISIQDVKTDYLILFFYDHECDVCHSEAHDLKTLLQQRDDIVVYAVDMNSPLQSLDDSFISVSATSTIGSNPTEAYDIETTPLIYVLDKDKRIIAKKLKADQIVTILP